AGRGAASLVPQGRRQISRHQGTEATGPRRRRPGKDAGPFRSQTLAPVDPSPCPSPSRGEGTRPLLPFKAFIRFALDQIREGQCYSVPSPLEGEGQGEGSLG